ncbi:MAG: hypothetical protein LUD24_03515 [Phascolarctobacterium sp.]|nr:hypothetical protein [Phascolarctobacterium sp.]
MVFWFYLRCSSCLLCISLVFSSCLSAVRSIRSPARRVSISERLCQTGGGALWGGCFTADLGVEVGAAKYMAGLPKTGFEMCILSVKAKTGAVISSMVINTLRSMISTPLYLH